MIGYILHILRISRHFRQSKKEHGYICNALKEYQDISDTLKSEYKSSTKTVQNLEEFRTVSSPKTKQPEKEVGCGSVSPDATTPAGHVPVRVYVCYLRSTPTGVHLRYLSEHDRLCMTRPLIPPAA